MIRYELLTGKPFQDIDYTKDDNVSDMLYCAVLCSNEDIITKDEFINICENGNLLKKMTIQLQRNLSIVQQFIFQKEKEGVSGENKNCEPNYIKDVISTLITYGMDARYILNEMELCDLPMYIEAYEKKKREDMESARLWTYYQVLPHMDARKMRSPKDLIEFPWETARSKEEAKLSMEKNIADFERFIAGELLDINKINRTKRDN